MNENCPFCRNNICDEDILLENKHCIYLRLDEPILIGSGIIIPKEHHETVFELSTAEIKDTFDLMKRAKKVIDVEHNPDGYNIGWNNGAVAGQEVFHAHLHVIPRYSDEPHSGKGIRYWLRQEENRRFNKKLHGGDESAPP